ncbi:energy-coupling factor transporter transmembrane protein EcfT [Synechococcus sp. CS-1325]|uniref:CbiQ family ECF transporter T component n=1 Tax=Synechococcus sp. CS-1325 TaxID=2847979 RepID=UPI00223B4B2C|nr:CbiQ family ECF transporter T component [Synechococcus sp. CS-1325]MCT0198313.1 energy-coupling factor transporter transmembrane protein EcfT [Synechococcus sp. CS-1325]
MDWLRQLPIGQFVDGDSSWLRRLDPRLKLGWTVAFLVTPILAGPHWRLALVALLILITACSGLPWRLWRLSLPALLALSLLVGLLSALVPAGAVPAASLSRSPAELILAPTPPAQPPPERSGEAWEVLRWGPVRLGPLPIGPLVVNRRSAELGLNSASLLFTLIHSANLLLVCTPPEELVWALSWAITPLKALDLPVERLGFTLLLALRFLPLVQEEFQNLLRSIATRAVNLRRLGWKASLGLGLAVAERLLANLLLRAEQGADALMARGGRWSSPRQLRLALRVARKLNWVAGLALIGLLELRWQYGAL